MVRPARRRADGGPADRGPAAAAADRRPGPEVRIRRRQKARNLHRSNTVGRLTQRLECHPHTVEVTGSNPVAPT